MSLITTICLKNIMFFELPIDFQPKIQNQPKKIQYQREKASKLTAKNRFMPVYIWQRKTDMYLHWPYRLFTDSERVDNLNKLP